jgi:hypothetical protein
MGIGGRIANDPTGMRPSGTKKQISINTFVKYARVPTPQASDATQCGERLHSNAKMLIQAVKRLPVPYSEGGPRGTPDTLASFVRVPTPRAQERAQHNSQDKGMALSRFVRVPTPRSEDSQCTGSHRGTPDTLTSFVRVPTPRAVMPSTMHQSKRGGLPQNLAIFVRVPTPRASKVTNETEEAWQIRKNAGKVHTPPLALAVAAGGQLNPTWVEFLMGWPLLWTSMEPLPPETWSAWRRAFGIESPD